jgi:protein SCO1/2
MKKFIILFVASLQMLSISHLSAQDLVKRADAVPKLGIYEHLNDTIPNLEFTNQDGEKVMIMDLLDDKPVIISLVYYECPGICTPLLNGLSDVVKQSDLALAHDYNIITLSFDHKETPALARKKKNTYKKINKNSNVEDGWQFLVGDSVNINKMLDAIGFQVKPDGEEFIHPAAIIAISPKGKIARYLNGTYFQKFDFMMAVNEAAEGRSGPTINKVLNYCFSYDADGKKYVFNITKVAAAIMIFFAVSFLLILIIKENKNRKKRLSEMSDN